MWNIFRTRNLYTLYIQYVEIYSQTRYYQGPSTSLPQVRASVWVGRRRMRCFNMCMCQMRCNSSVWSVPVLICQSLGNDAKLWEKDRLMEMCEVCCYVCVFPTLTCVLTDVSPNASVTEPQRVARSGAGEWVWTRSCDVLVCQFEFGDSHGGRISEHPSTQLWVLIQWI